MKVKLHTIRSWMSARIEIFVPLLGIPMFFTLVSFSQGSLKPIQTVLVVGLAAVYIGLIVWTPMKLPTKVPQPWSWAAFRRALTVIVPITVSSALLLIMLSLASGGTGEGKNTLGSFLLTLLLICMVSSAGLAAEQTLSIDLLPVLRKREVRRILYVLVAAFFLAMLVLFWDNLFSGVIKNIGKSVGETAPSTAKTATSFNVGNPLILLIQLFIGAGLYEELFFRLGLMTLIWAFTKRWGIGLVLSAVFFGFYHITPFSGISTFNASAPLITVLTSFTSGIMMGLIYRYRGLAAAVLVHSLGDWVVIMVLAGMAS